MGFFDSTSSNPTKVTDNRAVLDTGGAPTGGVATGAKNTQQSTAGLFSIAGKGNSVSIIDTGLVSANQNVMSEAMQFLYASEKLRAERDERQDALIGANTQSAFGAAQDAVDKIAAVTPGAQSNNFIYVALAIAGFVAYRAFK